MVKRCGTCYYGAKIEIQPDLARCHRFPPQVDDAEYRAEFPIVEINEDWCGEWAEGVRMAMAVTAIPIPSPLKPKQRKAR